MDMLDAFAILDLKNTASEEEIRAAYRKLAKKWHPDINKDPEAEETFKKINQAYDLLTKPKVQTREQEPFDDLFSQFFGKQKYDFFGGGFNRTSSVRSASITFELEDISQQVAEEIAQIIAEKGLKIKGYSFTKRT